MFQQNKRVGSAIKTCLIQQKNDIYSGASKTGRISQFDLKPVAPQLDARQEDDVDDSGTLTSTASSTRSTSTIVNPCAAATEPSAFPGSIPSLPPSIRSTTYSQSVASTNSFEIANPYHISTPKSDITVGLAHQAFTQRQQQCLVNHQASGCVLSDPHAADMGIRFPFLVVEAKGLSLNGSLISAQNQAAISSASMLRILRDLNDTTHSIPPSLPQCFSIVTEGPVHELWVHFEHNGSFHVESLRSWRTTRARDAYELVHFLSSIIVWGRNQFWQGIVERLDITLGHAVFG